MPINFGNPTTTQLRTNYASSLRDHQTALAQWLDDAVVGTLTATPTGAFRVRSANFGDVQRWNGTSWVGQPINGIHHSSSAVGIGGTPTRLLHLRATLNTYLSMTNDTSGHANTDGLQFLMGGLNASIINREAGSLDFSTSDTVRFTLSSGGVATFGGAVFAPSYAMSATGGTPSTGIAAPASSTLGFYANTIEHERILPSGRHLYGTATDAGPYRLQVVSDAATSWARWKAGAAAASYMDFQRGDTGATLGYLGSDGGGAVAGGTGANLALRAENALYLAAGGGVRVQIDASGNLAVGTTTPKTTYTTGGVGRLGMEAAASYTGLAAYAYSTNTSAGGTVVLGRSRSGTLGTLATTVAGNILGYVSWEGVNSSNALVAGAWMFGIQDGAASAGHIPAGIGFATNDGAGIANRHILLSTGHWQPQGTTETMDLGDSTHRYRTLYTKDLNITGTLFHSNSVVGAGLRMFGYGGLPYRIGLEALTQVADANVVVRDMVMMATTGFTITTTLLSDVSGSFMVYNNSGSSITITQGAGVTLRLAGSATTGNRTLAQRGFAFVFVAFTTEATLFGTGLS
jgi:hypothetical protein